MQLSAGNCFAKRQRLGQKACSLSVDDKDHLLLMKSSCTISPPTQAHVYYNFLAEHLTITFANQGTIPPGEMWLEDIYLDFMKWNGDQHTDFLFIDFLFLHYSIGKTFLKRAFSVYVMVGNILNQEPRHILNEHVTANISTTPRSIECETRKAHLYSYVSYPECRI